MFYAEINQNGKCFHLTTNPLPLSDTVTQTDDPDALGKIWDGEKFVEDPNIPEPEPSKLDTIEASQLTIMEALADQYELNEERRIDDLEVQAEIYESILALGGNV